MWDDVEYITIDFGRPAGKIKGYRQRKTIVVPAGSSSFQLVVPGNEVWRFRHLLVEYVSDAVVGTRIPALEFIDNDGNLWAAYAATVGQVASKTIIYQWRGDDGPNLTDAHGFQTMSVPDMYLNGGDAIEFGVSGSDVGDSIPVAVIVYEALVHGGGGTETGRVPDVNLYAVNVNLMETDDPSYATTPAKVAKWQSET